MTFILSEEQQLFTDSARKLLLARAPVAALRQLRDSRDAIGYDRKLWTMLAEMGWAGVLVPEKYGGVDFGYVGAGLAAEASGRTLTPLPMLSTAVLAVTALLKGGTEAQRSELLPAMVAGELLITLAVDEHSRHAPHEISTSAQTTASGFRLTGRKTFVLDGHVADKLIVTAGMSDSAALSLFLIDADAPGVTLKRTIMVDSRNAADVYLQDVAVARDDLIGPLDDGESLLDGVLDAARAVLAAELVGIARESLDRTLDYLRQREQFGRRIGEFQALQHRAAQLYCEIELACSAAYGALQALDTSASDASLKASVAKAKCSEVATFATNEAVQMHGGIGMTDEFDLGFFMKRARAAAETFGDYSFHSDRVARFYGI